MQRKNWLFITVASLGITFSLPTFAQENRPGYEKIRMNELPNEAQQAIKKEANGKEIKELVSITRNGRTWYQARIEDRAGDKYVSVGRDGKVQNVSDKDDNNNDNNRNNRNDTAARGNNDLPQGYRKVEMNDLPEEARRAIRQEANGKEIKELVSITRNDRTFYQARVEDRGADKYISVGRDGKIQNVADADNNNTNRNDRDDRNATAARGNNDLPQGYRKVDMNDLPEEARRSIRQEANGKEIKELVSITRNDRTWYQARVEDRGADKYIAVGRDGKVQNVSDADKNPALLSNRADDRDNRADVRRRDRRTSFEGWQRDKLDPDRLPGEVKRTLGENDVKLNQLSEAWTNRRDGKTIYHVIEKGPTRETHYVVDENGKFLGEDNVTPEGRDRIEFDRLPGQVKTTLQRFGKPADFRRVVTVSDRTQTWYEARHENGEIYRVGRDGDLVDRQGDDLRR